MAARRRSKRSPRRRDQIRERQAYTSMEIALWEHEENQQSSLSMAGAKRTQKARPSFNTALAEALQNVQPSQPLNEPEAKQAQPKEIKEVQVEEKQVQESQEVAVQEPMSGRAAQVDMPELPAAPHEWMRRAANQGASDLSWFMLFVMLLFSLMGVFGGS